MTEEEKGEWERSFLGPITGRRREQEEGRARCITRYHLAKGQIEETPHGNI